MPLGSAALLSLVSRLSLIHISSIIKLILADEGNYVDYGGSTISQVSEADEMCIRDRCGYKIIRYEVVRQ